MDKQPAIEDIFQEHLYEPALMSSVTASGPIQKAYFEAFEKEASHSQFDSANRAAKAVYTLDETIGDDINAEQAFRILAAVTRAAESNAFEAKAVYGAKFNAAPKLRASAAKFGGASPIKAKRILTEFHVMASLKGLMTMLT